MAIYEPVFDSTGIFGGGEVGKDRPVSGNWASYKPKLVRGRGRAAAIIKGGQYLYRYLRNHPKISAGIVSVGGVAIGNAINNSLNKTLRSNSGHRGRKRSFRRNNSRANGSKRCCHCCN